MENKKPGNFDCKIFQNETKKIPNLLWEFNAISFQALEKLENFILYGKTFKIISGKLTKSMEFEYNLLINENKIMEFQ